MRFVRAALDVLKPYALPLNVVAALAGTYLAAGSVLLGAEIPSKGFWAPWDTAFVGLVGCAVYAPLYGLYKALDAEVAEQSRHTIQLQRDLAVNCQQVAAEVADRCHEVELNQLAAQVWLCGKDGSFADRVRFFLPHSRTSSGVGWCRGKGVAGVAWATRKTWVVDLQPLHKRAEDLGEDQFDALPTGERYGMTHAELKATEAYTCILAIPLFTADNDRTVLGVFVIDYMGTGGVDCIQETAQNWHTRAYVGACEKLLRSAGSPA